MAVTISIELSDAEFATTQAAFATPEIARKPRPKITFFILNSLSLFECAITVVGFYYIAITRPYIMENV